LQEKFREKKTESRGEKTCLVWLVAVSIVAGWDNSDSGESEGFESHIAAYGELLLL
jgi:hypothetical protein